MSKITDWAEQQQADLSDIQASLDGIAAGVVALDKKIEEFQNSPGTLTPADQAALDNIQSLSKSLASKARDIRVDAETHPTPPVPPVAT